MRDNFVACHGGWVSCLQPASGIMEKVTHWTLGVTLKYPQSHSGSLASHNLYTP